MDEQSQERSEVLQDQASVSVEKKLSPAEGIRRRKKSARCRKELIDQKSRPPFLTAIMPVSTG